MTGAAAFNVVVVVIATGVAAAAFWGANRATRSKAATDNRAVDAAAYGRATDIYESTITALRAEVTRLTEEVKGARTEIRQVRVDLAKLQATNDVLAGELGHLRSQEHTELAGFRERDAWPADRAAGPGVPRL